MEVTYEVQTDTDSWFTLRIDVLEIQASGAEKSFYYHIDKTTGERVELPDLFREDADYVAVLSDEVRKQMKERMAQNAELIYFCEEEEEDAFAFQQIQPNQNFYFDAKGRLVLVFDEYEVAPGYMGMQEFIIPDEVLLSIRKD